MPNGLTSCCYHFALYLQQITTMHLESACMNDKICLIDQIVMMNSPFKVLELQLRYKYCGRIIHCRFYLLIYEQ